jgi:hypothetical protein
MSTDLVSLDYPADSCRRHCCHDPRIVRALISLSSKRNETGLSFALERAKHRTVVGVQGFGAGSNVDASIAK